jgi:hypothetical protein
VLHAPKALLFKCRHEIAVAKEYSRHISVIGVDSEDI